MIMNKMIDWSIKHYIIIIHFRTFQILFKIAIEISTIEISEIYTLNPKISTIFDISWWQVPLSLYILDRASITRVYSACLVIFLVLLYLIDGEKSLTGLRYSSRVVCNYRGIFGRGNDRTVKMRTRSLVNPSFVSD